LILFQSIWNVSFVMSSLFFNLLSWLSHFRDVWQIYPQYIFFLSSLSCQSTLISEMKLPSITIALNVNSLFTGRWNPEMKKWSAINISGWKFSICQCQLWISTTCPLKYSQIKCNIVVANCIDVPEHVTQNFVHSWKYVRQAKNGIIIIKVGVWGQKGELKWAKGH